MDLSILRQSGRSATSDEYILEETAKRVKTEEILRRQIRFEKLLTEITAHFSSMPAIEIESEIENSQRKICDLLDIDRSIIWLGSDKGPGTTGPTFVYPGNGSIPGRLEAATSFPWCMGRLREGEVLAIGDISELPPEAFVDRRSWELTGTRSALMAPLAMKDTELLGAISFEMTRKKREWSDITAQCLRLAGLILNNALERAHTGYLLHDRTREIAELKNKLGSKNGFLKKERQCDAVQDIVGQCAVMKKLLAQVAQVAATDSTALILGETGTGKELLARAIYKMSQRSDKPLVTVNCASLPPTLIESELFGRERGAYTGAMTKMVGRFESADGATLFLDEIGELPLEMQSKFLRVLEQGVFERLGSTRPIKIDFRLIAATSKDLAEEVRVGKFRKDLYYRLNVFPIVIPPLRERSEDIPLLVWAFVNEFQERMGKPIETISSKSMQDMQQYSWPGNVRELRNLIERAMIVTSNENLVVTLSPLKSSTFVADPGSQDIADKEKFESAQRAHILKILEKVHWRITGKAGAAEILGLRKSTLQSKMKKLGIKRPFS